MKTKGGIYYSIRDIIAMRLCYLAFRIAPKDIKPYYARAFLLLLNQLRRLGNDF